MDLSTLTDLNQLNELYVQCNESLLQAQSTVQVETNNLASIRSRISQLRQQNEQNLEAAQPINETPVAEAPNSNGTKSSRKKSK